MVHLVNVFVHFFTHQAAERRGLCRHTDLVLRSMFHLLQHLKDEKEKKYMHDTEYMVEEKNNSVKILKKETHCSKEEEKGTLEKIYKFFLFPFFPFHI